MKSCALSAVIILLLFDGFKSAKAALLSPSGPPQIKPKQFQQFQIVVLPPGSPQPPPQSPPGPGFVWVQVPSEPNLPPHQPAVVQPAKPEPPSDDGDLNKKCLSPRGQFPSSSCNKYVNCWDGVAIEQFCPEGLVFNPRGYCDYPANVNCGGRPVFGLPPSFSSTSSPVRPSSPTQAPPTVIVTLPTVDPNLKRKCLRPRGQFRSDSCNKYVNCWDDVVVEQECPEGLFFSTKGYCDYPQNVNCQNTLSPPRASNQDAISKECPLDFGTFREKLNCSNYFTCIGGKIVAQYTCPPGFSFNDNIGVCDYSDRVDCTKDPLIFSPKTNFLKNIPPDFMQKIDNCQPGSVFPLNPECSVACLCREGLSEIVQCPQGLAYDKKTDKCVPLHLANC